jgi:hypothetical protein
LMRKLFNYKINFDKIFSLLMLNKHNFDDNDSFPCVCCVCEQTNEWGNWKKIFFFWKINSFISGSPYRSELIRIHFSPVFHHHHRSDHVDWRKLPSPKKIKIKFCLSKGIQSKRVESKLISNNTEGVFEIMEGMCQVGVMKSS